VLLSADPKISELAPHLTKQILKGGQTLKMNFKGWANEII